MNTVTANLTQFTRFTRATPLHEKKCQGTTLRHTSFASSFSLGAVLLVAFAIPDVWREKQATAGGSLLSQLVRIIKFDGGLFLLMISALFWTAVSSVHFLRLKKMCFKTLTSCNLAWCHSPWCSGCLSRNVPNLLLGN